ncbi:MAG: S8 family serine peptidase, partial [Actinobacteria bacterium]|nr:S8 family serine peptidase [Actinomycetota bacterium]
MQKTSGSRLKILAVAALVVVAGIASSVVIGRMSGESMGAIPADGSLEASAGFESTPAPSVDGEPDRSGPMPTDVKSADGENRPESLSVRLAELSQPDTQALAPIEQAARLDLPATGPGSLVIRDGRVLVYVRVAEANPVDVRVGAEIAALGGVIVNVADDYAVITAELPKDRLVEAGGVDGVLAIDEVLAPSIAAESVVDTGNSVQTTCATGVVSEADTQLRAALARSTFGVDGTGIKIGVLSDSYDTDITAATDAAADVAAGDLPGPGNPCGHATPVTVLTDYPNGSDEGRGMLQSVHDLAPGAQLAFASAFVGVYDFAAQIRALRDWGADVIVDDISYFNEPFFQDGPISVAVNDVTATGVTYFSSAGNSNEVVGGREIASFESPSLRSTSCPATVVAESAFYDKCHDFDSGVGTDTGWGFTMAQNGAIGVNFQYAEPWSGVTTDLDIFLLDATTDEVLASSEDANLTGTQIPFEFFNYSWGGSARDLKIVIARYSGTGTPRLKMILMTANGLSNIEYDVSNAIDTVGPTIFGHNGAATAGSVGAVRYDDSTRPEYFSSRGPIVLEFGPVLGSTPAQRLGSPLVVNKPDFAATDGAATSFFGQLSGNVWRFYGTSQSAPHAAAIAALLAQYRPLFTPAEILARLRATSVAVANGGTIEAVGSGLLDAYGALDALAVVS